MEIVNDQATRHRNNAAFGNRRKFTFPHHSFFTASLKMRWPWSSNTSNDDDTKNSTASKSRVSWSESLNRTDWRHFTEPQVIIPSVVFTITTLATIRLYKRYVRRIGSIDGIRKDAFRTRSIFGRVTSVGDGDNFRLYHTPGGRLMGWGWLRKVPERREQLSGKTVSTYALQFVYGVVS